ncbi:tryptophan synthase subunit alpha [Luteimonas sp. A534]
MSAVAEVAPRMARRFAALRAAGRKALVPFITAGDPGLEDTVPVMHAMVAAGADAIELGVPFSDPMADGPTIQRSSERALARGAGMAWVLERVREFRQRDDDTPVTLMGYLNPIEIRGPEAFAKAAADAGVDGVLLVDLPPEEATEFRKAFSAHGVALVLLASPTTGPERVEMLCSLAQGYLYYVSFAGVTGDSARLDAGAAAAQLRAIRARSPVPVVAGFGIHDAASAAAMAVDADGVVVGSALVKVMAAAGSGHAAAAAAAFLAPLRSALDAGAAGTVG